MALTINEVLSRLEVGTELLLPKEDLIKKLTNKKNLKIKFGMDPTSPNLHLGHAIALEKLKTFQVHRN